MGGEGRGGEEKRGEGLGDIEGKGGVARGLKRSQKEGMGRVE